MPRNQPVLDDNTLIPEETRQYPTPDQLARQFEEWERRGRGWQVWDYPVELEPPFDAPPLIPPTLPARDDARRLTLIGSLLERLRGGVAPGSLSLPYPVRSGVSPQRITSGTEPPHELQLYLPRDLKVTAETAEQMLLSLFYTSHPVSFEVIGGPETIYVQYTCHTADLGQLREQLKSHFPEAVIGEEQGLLSKVWGATGERAAVIADFGLASPFVLPLQTIVSFDSDPLMALSGALTSIAAGEAACLQVIFQAARGQWAERIARHLTSRKAKALLTSMPEMLALVKRKISRPLFAAVVRVAARATTKPRAWQLIKGLGGGLTQFSNPIGNSLIPLSNEGYGRIDHERCLLTRQTMRSGMLLSSPELVSIVHPPSLSVRVPQLQRIGRRTKAAPAVAHGHALVLGDNQHGGTTVPVTLSDEQRTRHMYVVGASGTGKSTLLLNLICQDIEQGQGLAVFDPHGDLIDQILGRIPESRFDDVVLFDPSDDEYPIGFNILSAHSELEKTLLESDLVGVFRRLSTSWGDQMNSVLSNAILAFLESKQGGSLADMRRFLVEPEFRREFLQTVKDREVIYYWLREFPLLSGRPQAPLLTRLDTFLRPKPIRYMVSQLENKIDFAEVMNKGKIFLAKLSQGAIGEENSYLLGSFLVTKFHQMALSRQEINQGSRRNFWLYIDEFQNFVTPSMASILSGARKYRLGLILAHQELRQISSQDTQVTSAVTTNPYTRICFRMGDDDAKRLSEGFSHFDATDLQNLSVGEALCRMERAEFDFNLHTHPLVEIDNEEANEKRIEIQRRSRLKYARPKAEIEADLDHQQSMIPAPAKRAEMTKSASKQRIRPTPSQEPDFVPPPQIVKAIVPTELPLQEEIAEPDEEPIQAQEGKSTRSSKAKLLTPQSVQPGKGGQQHKYLQQLIKRWGEERGYKSTIEKQIAGGSVDVAFEKDGQKIACEITMTTTVEHEVGNITKCLMAGFDQIIVIASDKRVLRKIQTAAQAEITTFEFNNVHFFLPEDLYMYLDQMAVEGKCKEEVVKGYKVKVQYKALTVEEQKVRKEAIAKTVLQALKRLKE